MDGSCEPMIFVDISEYFKVKIQAVKAYEGELMEFLHSRSIKGIETLARWCGISVGSLAAKIFMAKRIVKSS